MASEGGKKFGVSRKTIERSDATGCRRSGLLRRLTFRSLIAFRLAASGGQVGALKVNTS